MRPPTPQPPSTHAPVDPASLKIVRYPHPALRAPAKPIAEINASVRAVAARMIELMHDNEGVGLAAPQVGLSWRMFVVHVPENDERSVSSDPPSANVGPRVYINPTLVAPRGSLEPFEEGCLSLPNIAGDVLRPPVITIRATDENGVSFEETGAGLLARCWQHEYDHLEGVLIIDRMTQIYRIKNRSAIRRLEQASAK